MSAIDVVQGVRVLGVEVEGEEIRVDVFGGEECLCGVVLYRFPDAAERAYHLRTLSAWCEDQTAVTYVCTEGMVTLVEEDALLTSAFED